MPYRQRSDSSDTYNSQGAPTFKGYPGDLCYDTDNNVLYKCTYGTTWAAIGSIGSMAARTVATGGQPAQLAADGNNSTPVVTELYVAEFSVPLPCLVTGVAVFAGSVWSDNFKAGIYDSAGTLIRATASTAGSTTADAYQRAAFATGPLGAAATTVTLSPGTYYVGLCLDGTTSRFNTFAVGNFGAGKITGLVYATNFAAAGTALTITPPTTFTTALGPIASLY